MRTTLQPTVLECSYLGYGSYGREDIERFANGTGQVATGLPLLRARKNHSETSLCSKTIVFQVLSRRSPEPEAVAS